MELYIALGALLGSAAILYIAGELLVYGLLVLARHFRVKEFMVAFFVMSFAASVPNFFVGVTSVLQGIPELSFGDIMGSNIIILTLAIGLAVLFSPGRRVPLENRVVQDMAFLTALAALLPVVLMMDGMLSRGDGLALVLFFGWYLYWLYGKRDHFTKVLENDEASMASGRLAALRAIGAALLGVTLLATASQGIVYGALTVAEIFNIPLVLFGLLVVSFAGALPEVYFTVISARKGETGLLIGSLMGAVIVPATLVLGLVAIMQPIDGANLEFPVIARMFLVLVAVFFLYVSRTRNIITVRESVILVALYVCFVMALLGAWW